MNDSHFDSDCTYYSKVTWRSWHSISLATRRFVQQFGSTIKKMSTLLSFSEGDPSLTGGFPSQRLSIVEDVSCNCIMKLSFFPEGSSDNNQVYLCCVMASPGHSGDSNKKMESMTSHLPCYWPRVRLFCYIGAINAKTFVLFCNYCGWFIIHLDCRFACMINPLMPSDAYMRQ